MSSRRTGQDDPPSLVTSPPSPTCAPLSLVHGKSFVSFPGSPPQLCRCLVLVFLTPPRCLTTPSFYLSEPVAESRSRRPSLRVGEGRCVPWTSVRPSAVGHEHTRVCACTCGARYDALCVGPGVRHEESLLQVLQGVGYLYPGSGHTFCVGPDVEHPQCLQSGTED